MKVAFLICFVVTFLGVESTFATVTLRFTEFAGGSIAGNFATFEGTPRTGMRWGIVIDTANNGFSLGGGAYESFTPTSQSSLSAVGTTSDDYFFPSSALTIDSSGFTEAGGTPGSPGTITLISSVPVGPNGISTNDSFALIWFSNDTASAGSRYGFFTNSSFLIPADSQTVSYSSVFTGVDSIKPANLTILVPEPSSALLIALGAVLLVRRRRH